MSRFQPALLGGLFIGVLSSLPMVGSANVCCCLWVVVGGLLTVYLLQQNRTVPVETAEAALQGLVAGALGAAIYVAVFSLLLGGAVAGGLAERLRSAMDLSPQVPPEMREMVLKLFSGGGFVVLLAAITVPVYAVFSMLGAFLGLAVFRKRTPSEPPA